MTLFRMQLAPTILVSFLFTYCSAASHHQDFQVGDVVRIHSEDPLDAQHNPKDSWSGLKVASVTDWCNACVGKGYFFKNGEERTGCTSCSGKGAIKKKDTIQLLTKTGLVDIQKGNLERFKKPKVPDTPKFLKRLFSDPHLLGRRMRLIQLNAGAKLTRTLKTRLTFGRAENRSCFDCTLAGEGKKSSIVMFRKGRRTIYEWTRRTTITQSWNKKHGEYIHIRKLWNRNTVGRITSLKLTRPCFGELKDAVLRLLNKREADTCKAYVKYLEEHENMKLHGNDLQKLTQYIASVHYDVFKKKCFQMMSDYASDKTSKRCLKRSKKFVKKAYKRIEKENNVCAAGVSSVINEEKAKSKTKKNRSVDVWSVKPQLIKDMLLEDIKTSELKVSTQSSDSRASEFNVEEANNSFVPSRRQSSPVSVPDNGKQVEAKRRASTSALDGNGREISTDEKTNETAQSQKGRDLPKRTSETSSGSNGSAEIAGAVQTPVDAENRDSHNVTTTSDGSSSQTEMTDESERGSSTRSVQLTNNGAGEDEKNTRAGGSTHSTSSDKPE